MMPKEPQRSARIEARIAPDALALVKLAAAIEGRSVSAFVVAAARRAIEDAHLIRLSMDDQQRFAELLLNPPRPSPALKGAKAAHSRLIRESR